jgi:hypothetical protein
MSCRAEERNRREEKLLKALDDNQELYKDLTYNAVYAPADLYGGICDVYGVEGRTPRVLGYEGSDHPGIGQGGTWKEDWSSGLSPGVSCRPYC